MSLLSLVSLSDKNFMDHRVEVEWQYLDLIYGTIRLYRRIPSISENEGKIYYRIHCIYLMFYLMVRPFHKKIHKDNKLPGWVSL